MKRNKRNWLYNAPFPPILLKYPNIINEYTCKPYKLNKVAGEMLTNLNLKCETVAIILSSSVTFHKRAVKIYDLIKRNNNQHEICVFVLTNEFAGIQDLDQLNLQIAQIKHQIEALPDRTGELDQMGRQVDQLNQQIHGI